MATPAAAAPTTATAAQLEKDWGTLTPIRTVPKPSEAKSTYILANTERVILPEEEGRHRKGMIIGSILAFLVIAGGTLAFVFFGRDAKTNNASTLQVVNAIVNSANTSTVFPAANATVTTNAANMDSDNDGLTDAAEATRGTDPKKIDTDGDGFTDGQEVQGGYNPLGAGKL